MAETKTKVATIRGTLLKPGVSKNKRLYTAENIRSAAEAAKSDLAAGKTLNMYTTHKAAEEDDPMALVGMFTKVWQDASDESLKFEADVPNTTTGRDYANLTAGKFQRTISIRGGWGSTPTIEDYDGQQVLTAPTLRLGGADGTAMPGVEGAAIEGIDFLESFVESDGNFNPASFMNITESVDVELVPFTEDIKPEISEDVMERVFEFLSDALEADDPQKPYGNVTYADPGYQADKKKRYPLDSEQHVKAAWSYINVAKNAAKYSSAQLSRIKGKIKSAAKKYGINIAEWYEDFVAGILESLEVAGINEMYASMTISNGDGSVTTNGYASDGTDLLQVAHRIALAAIMGMYFIDPDQDGDVDPADPVATAAAAKTASKPSESNDTISQVESADNTEETTNKETTSMSDTTIPAGTADTAPANETAPVVAATESAPAAPTIDYKALAAEILTQQTEAAEAAKVEADRIAAEEAAKPVTFSQEEVAALVANATETAASEATAKALEEARRSGNVSRVGHTTESANAYYESVKESEEAQATFLGKLSTTELQNAMSAVLNDDRNLVGTAPKLAANVR